MPLPTNIAFRLRGSAITGVSDGATIANATDEAGSIALAGVGAAPPVLRTTGAHLLNGKAVIDFFPGGNAAANGSAGGGRIGAVDVGALYSTLTGNHTFVFVVKVKDGGLGTLASKNGASERTSFMIYGQLGAASGLLQRYPGPTSTVAINDNAYHVVMFTLDATSRTASFFVDGQAAGSGQATQADADAGASFCLGATNENQFCGAFYLAEAQAYNSVLSAGERQAVADYVYSEYGLGAPPPGGGVSNVRIVGCGDSIMAQSPGGVNPLTLAASQLSRLLAPDTVSAVNLAVNGVSSADWTVGNNLYNQAVGAFTTGAVALISIGTNDASVSNAASKATYKTRLTATANGLAGAGYLVVLCAPKDIVNPSGNYNANSNTLLAQYRAAVVEITDADTTGKVRLGDTKQNAWFLAHTDELTDGVHLTAAGANSQGVLYAGGIAKALAVVDSTGELTVDAIAVATVQKLMDTTINDMEVSRLFALLLAAPFGAAGSVGPKGNNTETFNDANGEPLAVSTYSGSGANRTTEFNLDTPVLVEVP